MKILTPGEIIAQPYKILLHSNPGDGKTTLATSLPWGSEIWGESAAYVPFDMKERSLLGVLPEHHARLHVMAPADGAYDPYTFAMECLDWKAPAGCNTIILDTVTSLSRQVLYAAAQSSLYGKKSIGTGAYAFGMPDKPHYGVTHTMINNVVTKIKASRLNVIALFWSDWQEPQSGEPGGLYGGPATVNMTMSKDIAGEFDHVFYLRRESDGKGMRYFVHTANHGFWSAKMPTGALANPIPVTDVTGAPEKFWVAFTKIQEARRELARQQPAMLWPPAPVAP